ncbi:MAG: hypothetical protein IJY99_02215, partial [Alphaproteobacteria bacterium]|nr:hypothetical protein [Alphaproteobacteria bacterium]
NSLMPLYTEYVALANDLKVRKAALGMQPGIESEAILEGATSGLYDDVALGKTGGAYASLARALSDPNSEDAKKWAAQKEEAAKDKKTGTTLAAVGAIGSAVANIAINKNAPKEGSDEIEAKYDKKRVSADTLEKGDIDVTDGSNDDNKGTVGGTVPQSDKIADKECSPACNADTQNCVDGVCVEKVKKCASNQDLVDGECKPKCGTDETRDDSGECVKKITEKKQRSATCPSGQIFVPDGSGCDTRENILARDKTEWYPHSGAGMKYYGDDFYQSGSDQKYYDYLLEVNEACVKAGGTLNRKMKILEDYKNIKGGYSTYLFTSCDFKDGDKSNKSMRCKNTFGKYNFTQSCPENGLYRCCEILAPKK